jgi:CRP/FNR family cyclic AMP-dependent transcriptional regulator
MPVQKFFSNSVTSEDVERLLKRIPFFNDVSKQSEQQFLNLIELADIREVAPGDTLIHKGETDMYLYFLLKGKLAVFLEDTAQAPAISHITPGEVFGILSMITATPRSAFIKADTGARSSIIYKLNFAFLADESDTSKLSLETKLIFYRMAVHNIRWTVEQKKMANPKHPLVGLILKLPFIKAEKGTQEELIALKEQAKSLSEIIFLWNEHDKNEAEKIQIG